MEFDDYMHKTAETAVYKDAGLGTDEAISYVILSLAGEVGELCNTYKKHLRGDDLNGGTQITESRRQKMFAELRGTLWYTARAIRELGGSFTEQAKENLDELHRRKLSGKIKGDGDKR